MELLVFRLPLPGLRKFLWCSLTGLRKKEDADLLMRDLAAAAI